LSTAIEKNLMLFLPKEEFPNSLREEKKFSTSYGGILDIYSALNETSNWSWIYLWKFS